MSTTAAAAQLRQWCQQCQRATLTVIIGNVSYCANCEPDGPDDWGDDDDE